MGAFASHIIFGWEGKKKWQECGMLSVCRKHQGIFEMGCQGPDLFLYNPAMLFSTYDKNLGERMHVEKCGRFMACLADVIRQQEEKEAVEVGLSYLMGLLAHYTLDTSLHPYVYARTGYDPADPYAPKATMGIHFRLEAAIDANLIAQKLGIMPNAFYPEKTMHAEKKEKTSVAEMIAQSVSCCYHLNLKKEAVLDSMFMMQHIVPQFFDRTGRRKKYLSKFEFPIWEDGLFSNLFVEDAYVGKHGIMNGRNATWYHPWDLNIVSKASVWEIYEEALEQYDHYIQVWQPYFQKLLQKIMNNYSKQVYNGQADQKAWHDLIVDCVAKTGCYSYHSGLPVEQPKNVDRIIL